MESISCWSTSSLPKAFSAVRCAETVFGEVSFFDADCVGVGVVVGDGTSLDEVAVDDFAVSSTAETDVVAALSPASAGELSDLTDVVTVVPDSTVPDSTAGVVTGDCEAGEVASSFGDSVVTEAASTSFPSSDLVGFFCCGGSAPADVVDGAILVARTVSCSTTVASVSVWF